MTKLPSLQQQLSTLVSTPSVSSCNPAYDQSNQGVIDLLSTWLNDLGFDCKVMPLADQPHKANLLATLGSGEGGLVLSGHTDTVPFDAGKWQSDPFSLTEKDNRFYGLGSSDMKSFFALAIEAARAFKASDFSQPLLILATADEESSMQGARELSQPPFRKARYAVVGEPTSLRPIRLHKGILMDKITVHGRTGHSSNPDAGLNAMDIMHTVMGELMQFRAEMASKYQHSGFDIDIPTLNLGCIHGGDNPNRICRQCELQFDIRCVPGMDSASLRSDIATRIEAIAKRSNSQIDYESLVSGVEPFEQAAESALVQVAEELTGTTAGSVAYGTEAPFLRELGMDTIVMGPGSIDQAHQPDEYLELHQIKPCVKLLSQLIDRFCVQPGDSL